MRSLPAAFLLVLSGCGRYADFALPPPETAGPRGPFSWIEREGPVLERGASSDVLNPSLVRFQDRYLNVYSEFDGSSWHSAAAWSRDGIAWENPRRVLSPQGWEGSYIAANGSALVTGDEILYWYVAGDPPRIALARSRDGLKWIRNSEPVLPVGPRGSFDERAVADPYVIRRENYLYMFYLGQDRARRQRLGVARSKYGAAWEKLRANPLLELGPPGAFDEIGLGEPAVWSSGGFYWMLYTGRDRGERRRLGLARSTDGVRWQRDTSFSPVAGAGKWDSQVICDPAVEAQPDGTVRVWFGGGDVPQPDHGLHGQIGMATLAPRK